MNESQKLVKSLLDFFEKKKPALQKAIDSTEAEDFDEILILLSELLMVSQCIINLEPTAQDLSKKCLNSFKIFAEADETGEMMEKYKKMKSFTKSSNNWQFWK